MLPSTGYFKAINCPFYESGSCDRPYCHFKHSKRDAGSTTESTETLESRLVGQPQESKTTAIQSESDVLQQLVTEAVKKVLATQDVTDTEKLSCQNVVSQVVEGLKPTLTSGSSSKLDVVATETAKSGTDETTPLNKPVPCVYNPTPIAELKKRHIPIISYMPTRESRVAVKRKCSPEGIKPWLGISCETPESQTTEVKYKPTTIISSEIRDINQSYIPTCRSDSVSSNSYEEGSSNEYLLKLREAYYPKCKKRREEYVPKKVKAPLKTVENLSESTLARFTSDFDITDEVSPDIKHVSNVQLDKESIEPKFSDDDDDNAENDNDNRDIIKEYDRTEKKGSDEFVPQSTSCREVKKDNFVNGKINSNDELREASWNEKILSDNDVSMEEESITKEISKITRCEKDNAVKIAVDKSVKKNTKECRNRDKSGSKDRKSHDSSHRSHKERRDSNEKSCSTSRSRSKDKSHSRRENKNSKSKRHDKDKSRGKEQEQESKERSKKRSKEKSESRHKSKDKKSYRKSEKHREHDSKNSSESSRRQEYRKKKCDENMRRKISDKTDVKTIEESRIQVETSERISVDKRKCVESIRANSDDDDDDEDDDHHNTVVDNDIDDTILTASDSDHDVQEECLKIFQEYQAPDRPKDTMISPKESMSILEIEQNEDTGKKRIAHPSAATCVSRQAIVSQQQKKLINPQQKMYERWRLMRDTITEKTGSANSNIMKDIRRSHVEATGAVAYNNELKLNGNGRVRIAHVPYAKSLAIEKKKLVENVNKLMDTKVTDNNKTAAQTAKSGVRIAHVPQMVPQLIRPEPLQVTTQKFPLNVRQYYVNMMHDVCVQIYTNAEDAAQRAVKEEYACHERCKALAVYKNSCMLAAHRLRKEIDQNPSLESSLASTSGSSMVSHEAVLAGKAKGSWSVLKTKRSVTEFRGAMLYNMLKKWIMTEQQLRDNGFPRPHPDGQKGRAKIYVINSRNQSVLSKVPNERICSRCGQAYVIDKQGFALRQQNCIYHWGRKITIRGEGKYTCCQQYGSATGCCDAKTHVWEYTDYENLRGYVRTLPKDMLVEEQGVYALDCEMSYTTQGLELTRITVIDDDCNVVYETLVKPQNAIIDYNTRFSGITEESMKDVTTTLLDVQATLLTMFSEKTILVGHSLESDFKALRLLHDTVVDTSVMFPHKNGYPQKRALKNLCSEYLRKLIQNDVGGHDSKEDAVACMELILWKAKEEAKLQ
ncbi:uncharacterized protein LOC143181256 isoform X2 [Calliopsis andreniformis]|uniref:uncharacterized protein LOC143181256 isoform X2 n=1 Tax=Calliopsis andreniformis TaxID=337506 RepID=UPI003FCC8565